jgi:hypothetical protein
LKWHCQGHRNYKALHSTAQVHYELGKVLIELQGKSHTNEVLKLTIHAQLQELSLGHHLIQTMHEEQIF